MRNVVLSMMVSLDGYIEAADHDLSWHVFDDEMAEYMIAFFDTVDTILFGRKTYELMESFWPTDASNAEDPTIRERMNSLPKIVYSRTLEKAGWNNTTLMRQLVPRDVREMKAGEGKDMVIFGGADLASSFMKDRLIDRYQIIVNPVVLGDGNPLFKKYPEKLGLRLRNARPFDCGNVALVYEPE